MVFYPIVIAGTGMLLGMDTLVAQAFGAQDLRDCRRTLINGLWLALALTPVVTLPLWGMLPLLRFTGTNPRVMDLLREKEMTDVLVVVGGTIPDEDAEKLKSGGVAAVFQPGASLDQIVEFIRASVEQPA